MINVFKFKPKRRPTRIEAAQWLCLHFTRFPELEGDYSENLFHGWRFVRGAGDGLIYFANCIEPGISEAEFLEFLAMEMAE